MCSALEMSDAPGNVGQYKSFDSEKKEKKKNRVPRRILHFSDGTIEEFSTDDEGEEELRRQDEKQAVVDPASLAWLPWALYLAWTAATRSIALADSMGEKLAWWLGITSPKYYYEIQEARRMARQEEERAKQQDAEMAGWVGDTQQAGLVHSEQQLRGRECGQETETSQEENK